MGQSYEEEKIEELIKNFLRINSEDILEDYKRKVNSSTSMNAELEIKEIFYPSGEYLLTALKNIYTFYRENEKRMEERHKTVLEDYKGKIKELEKKLVEENEENVKIAKDICNFIKKYNPTPKSQ